MLFTQHGPVARLTLGLFCVLASAVMLFAVLFDVFLAFVGGLLIGVALGAWLIPMAVDNARLDARRFHRHRRER